MFLLGVARSHDRSGAALRETPIEDEFVSDEEERAVASSKEWFRDNQGIPFEEVVADLGFTMDQIRGHM